MATIFLVLEDIRLCQFHLYFGKTIIYVSGGKYFHYLVNVNININIILFQAFSRESP